MSRSVMLLGLILLPTLAFAQSRPDAAGVDDDAACDPVTDVLCTRKPLQPRETGGRTPVLMQGIAPKRGSGGGLYQKPRPRPRPQTKGLE